MLRLFSRRPIVFLKAAVLISTLSACGGTLVEDSGVTSAPVKDVAFSSFCSNLELENCQVTPEDSHIDPADWDFGVLVFKELLASPSAIKIQRSEFERPNVRKFFEVIGASSLLAFVNKVPWSSLEIRNDSIILNNLESSQFLDFHGLRVTALRTAGIKVLPNGTFAVSDIFISSRKDPSQKTLHKLLNIDLRHAGAMQLTTDKARIVDFPTFFFNIDGLVTESQTSPSVFFNALADVILDPNSNWRHDFNVVFNNSNLRKILDGSGVLDGNDSAFNETVRQIVQNASYLVIGGPGDIVLSVSGKAPLKCVMSFEKVPVIGNINIGLDFAAGFGLRNVKRLPSGNVQIEVYGIKTDLGTVSSGEINGNELRLKVGPLTLPFAWEEQSNGNGTSLKSISCE